MILMNSQQGSGGRSDVIRKWKSLGQILDCLDSMSTVASMKRYQDISMHLKSEKIRSDFAATPFTTRQRRYSVGSIDYSTAIARDDFLRELVDLVAAESAQNPRAEGTATGEGGKVVILRSKSYTDLLLRRRKAHTVAAGEESSDLQQVAQTSQEGPQTGGHQRHPTDPAAASRSVSLKETRPANEIKAKLLKVKANRLSWTSSSTTSSAPNTAATSSVGKRNNNLSGSRQLSGSAHSLLGGAPGGPEGPNAPSPVPPPPSSSTASPTAVGPSKYHGVTAFDLMTKPNCKYGYLSIKKLSGIFGGHKRYWCALDGPTLYICAKDTKQIKLIVGVTAKHSVFKDPSGSARSGH